MQKIRKQQGKQISYNCETSSLRNSHTKFIEVESQKSPFEIGQIITWTRGKEDKISTFVGLWVKISDRDHNFSDVVCLTKNGLEFKMKVEVLSSDLKKKDKIHG